MCGTGTAGEAWGESGIHDEKHKLPVKMKDFDYEQLAVRSPIREADAGYASGRTSPALTYLSGVQVPGAKYYIRYGWIYGMPDAKTAGTEKETAHKFDEIMVQIGGDPQNPENLGGDVEFNLGGQLLSFDTTSAFFIPRGVKHGRLTLKKYRHPYMVVSIMCGAATLKETQG
jgi:hypothetical protein